MSVDCDFFCEPNDGLCEFACGFGNFGIVDLSECEPDVADCAASCGSSCGADGFCVVDANGRDCGDPDGDFAVCDPDPDCTVLSGLDPAVLASVIISVLCCCCCCVGIGLFFIIPLVCVASAAAANNKPVTVAADADPTAY